jgi:hypothetical protein
MKIETRLALLSNGIFFVIAAFYTLAGVLAAVTDRYLWTWYYGALVLLFAALGVWFTLADSRLAEHRRIALMFTGKCIWKASARSGIRLGRFETLVFSWMVGIKRKRTN